VCVDGLQQRLDLLPPQLAPLVDIDGNRPARVGWRARHGGEQAGAKGGQLPLAKRAPRGRLGEGSGEGS